MGLRKALAMVVVTKEVPENAHYG